MCVSAVVLKLYISPSYSVTLTLPKTLMVRQFHTFLVWFLHEPQMLHKSYWSLLYFATLIPLIVKLLFLSSCSFWIFRCETFHYTHHQNQLSSEIKQFVLCFIFNCFQNSLIMCCFIISPASAFNKLYLIYLLTHLLITNIIALFI